MEGPVFWLVMALGPAAALMLYFYWRDRYEPEPLGLLLRMMGLGGLSVIPAVILELSTGSDSMGPAASAMSIAFNTFFIIGCAEEMVKFCAVYWFIYRNPEFDEVSDGVTYTVAASLGFAAIENVFYVMGAVSHGNGMSTALIRAGLAVPGHALFAVVMGYFIGRAKFAPSPSEERRFLLTGVIGAILLHGSYDFLCFSGQIGGVVLLVIGMWILALRLINHGQTLSPFKPGAVVIPLATLIEGSVATPSNVCPHCLRPWVPGSSTCPSCGQAGHAVVPLPVTASPSQSLTCPQCLRPVAPGSTTCHACGYHLQKS